VKFSNNSGHPCDCFAVTALIQREQGSGCILLKYLLGLEEKIWRGDPVLVLLAFLCHSMKAGSAPPAVPSLAQLTLRSRLLPVACLGGKRDRAYPVKSSRQPSLS